MRRILSAMTSLLRDAYPRNSRIASGTTRALTIARSGPWRSTVHRNGGELGGSPVSSGAGGRRRDHARSSDSAALGNPRGDSAPVRVAAGCTILSNYAWGTAFDINVAWNRLGTVPALRGERGSVRELVPLANAHGFYWGGHFSRRDGMHFEVTRPGPRTVA